ncbi:hypothetical protein Prudu_018511 [Prunus dulcis]|uniref:F-box domain-containing protein n=1 Tax=Prunus dulcis TaxID=3755 RepID=A0A4Y1RS39_PRUDU|nr:hypothetical protein Prudu_018511 [Prunus dulcis]
MQNWEFDLQLNWITKGFGVRTLPLITYLPTSYNYYNKVEVRGEDAKRRKTTTKGGGKKHNWMISIDRISHLPDEILVSILSLLSLKEAAITSLLSKRWQHLWASTDTLDFDSKLDVGNNVRFFRRLTPELRHKKSLRYVDWIREVANLVSFTYHGGSARLLLSDVPLLTEVSIEEADWGTVDSIRVVLPQLSCCILSQLEILMLDITPMTLVSPYLQRLVLKMKFVTWRRPKIKTAAKCPHPYLRVVEIVGYRGRACAAKHVMYLMKNAVSLEKIVIDPVLNHSTDKRVEEVKEEVCLR